MRRRASFSAVLALGLTFATAPAGATISEALSLDALVAQADLVLLVTCDSERALRDERQRIVTDYGLVVEDVLKGGASPGAALTMRRIGGEIGDLGMRIEGEPRLAPGDRYLVFLRSTAGGVLRPVGMSQGVLPVREEAGVPIVSPGGAGLALVERAGGGLLPAPAALIHPEPWERVRERVAVIVGRR